MKGPIQSGIKCSRASRAQNDALEATWSHRAQSSKHKEKRCWCVVYYICVIVYWAFSFNSFKLQLLCILRERVSFVLTVVTELNTQFECWIRDDTQLQQILRELEFNDLNIHLYHTLNYRTVSEHLKYSAWKLYGALGISCFCAFHGA